MLDYFAILTATGFTLYDKVVAPPSLSVAAVSTNAAASVRAHHYAAVTSHLLLSGSASSNSASLVTTLTHGTAALHVLHAPQRGLVLVAAHAKAVPAPYVGSLLERMLRVVVRLVDGLDANTRLGAVRFGRLETEVDAAAQLDAAFLTVLDSVESAADGSFSVSAPRGDRVNAMAAGSDDNDDENSNPETVGAARTRRPRTGKRSAGGKKGDQDHARKPGKQGRKWDDTPVTASDMDALDFSSAPPSRSTTTGSASGTAVDIAHLIDAASLGRTERDGTYNPLDLSTPSSLSGGSSTAVPSFLTSMKSIFTGTRTLTEAELAPLLSTMESHLIGKNVATHVARDLTAAVGASLVGQPIGWARAGTALRTAMESALTRVLLPSTATDLLRDIRTVAAAPKSVRRPYVAVFCGVNGVGKSTNLAKITFWLLRNGLKVMIAACDTFRSGAVEQLRTHVRNLRLLSEEMTGQQAEVDLFERGYGKDAAGIAKEAIAAAASRGFDVVLVDTAGRMQDNEPLMRSLAKLMATNQPDKVIFVGEALVGNEAIDQLTKFNAAIRDFSSQANPRDIDALILTKFDVIADKVGAAISMTYITQKPVLFVGTGQTYTDLKRINVGAVVDALLAD
ncbi:SRP54-type protein [Blastocladiella britannica]|nr:SRP54-type protein [Blastocladiella britannica]